MVKSNNVMLISHSGDCNEYFGNTLDAILNAFKKGATHVEIDVRRTKDGKLVLFHDPNTFKFNRRLVPISKVSFGELKALKFRKKGSLTTLSELFEVMKSGVGNFLLDVKLTQYEQDIIELIQKYKFERRVIVCSYFASTIKYFDKVCGNDILKSFTFIIQPWSIRKAIDKLKWLNADYTSVNFGNINPTVLDNENIGVIRNCGNINEGINLIQKKISGLTFKDLSLLENFKAKVNL